MKNQFAFPDCLALNSHQHSWLCPHPSTLLPRTNREYYRTPQDGMNMVHMTCTCILVCAMHHNIYIYIPVYQCSGWLWVVLDGTCAWTVAFSPKATFVRSMSIPIHCASLWWQDIIICRHEGRRVWGGGIVKYKWVNSYCTSELQSYTGLEINTCLHTCIYLAVGKVKGN